jgi:hypothetical protein
MMKFSANRDRDNDPIYITVFCDVADCKNRLSFVVTGVSIPDLECASSEALAQLNAKAVALHWQCDGDPQRSSTHRCPEHEIVE